MDDNPTTDDLLGFEVAVNVLTEVITDAPTRPLTIGVFGGWGSGKTSLMKMVEQRLHLLGIKTVWFNAGNTTARRRSGMR
jgi:predicted KAP-like P-loop ATPase